MAKTIFITGASRGFGKIWAEAFLKRGDKVVATARDLNTLKDLVSKYGDNILPIQLDVNDRAADFAAVKKAKDHFGSIDVLINNAGYGLFGAIEETSEKEAREQLRYARPGEVVYVSPAQAAPPAPSTGSAHK